MTSTRRKNFPRKVATKRLLTPSIVSLNQRKMRITISPSRSHLYLKPLETVRQCSLRLRIGRSSHVKKIKMRKRSIQLRSRTNTNCWTMF